MRVGPGVVVAILATAHLTLRVGLGIGDVAPDLMTLAVLFGARFMRTPSTAALGFGLGLLQDAFSPLTFGASALAMALVGAVASRTRQLFVGNSFLFLASYFFVGKWTLDFIWWLASGSAGWATFSDRILVAAPLAALYATATGLLVHFLFRERRRRP